MKYSGSFFTQKQNAAAPRRDPSLLIPGDISGNNVLREISPGTMVCGRYRRGQRFAGDIAGGTIIFKGYGNFTRPYLRLCLIISAPGSWGKRHGKRFSSPKPPTLSAGAAQIWGAMVIRDLGGGGLRQGICGAFFLRLRITP
jgi:hypothetical protein